MNLNAFLSVGVGAAGGAWLRWWLGLKLNAVFPTLPLGTLAANLLGGFLAGVALGYFAHNESLSPAVRLFVMTGFLGGLTTFSTFSAEVTTLFARHDYGWGFATMGAHVAGSLLMTALGLVVVGMLHAWARA